MSPLAATLVALALAAAPAQSTAAAPVQTTAAAREPAPSRRSPAPGDRMVQAGVGVVVLGVAGYGLLAAGLGIGNRAEADLALLGTQRDLEARRDVLARGRLGNRLAIAGGVTATAALAVGIPLIVIGRRRHEAASPRAMVVLHGRTDGLGLRVQGRF